MPAKSSDKANGASGAASHKLDMSSLSVETDFVRRLMSEPESGAFDAFFTHLKSLSPSSTDLEIRSLVSLAHLERFLVALTQRLLSHRDFEAVQTYLAMFLRIHGDVLIENWHELGAALRNVKAAQDKESRRLSDMTMYALGTLAFLRSTPVV